MHPDIYTYHRGREGQEPRDAVTGELLCDTEPVTTNHGWLPPATVVNIKVNFPIGDPHEEEYVDSDLEEEEKNDGNEAKFPASPCPERRAARTARAALSRATLRPGDGPGADATAAPAAQRRSKALPHYREVVRWDLADPATPSPEEYAARVACEWGLTFPQAMDLKDSIEDQLDDHCRQRSSVYFPSLVARDPYGAARPDAHFWPPEPCAFGTGARPRRVAAPKKGGPHGGKARTATARTATKARGRSAPAPRTRPPALIKPDRREIHVVPPDRVPAHDVKGDPHAREVLARAKAHSQALVAAAVARGEEALTATHSKVCHICKYRKESLLTFHCGKHHYCDNHCAVSGPCSSDRACDLRWCP